MAFTRRRNFPARQTKDYQWNGAFFVSPVAIAASAQVTSPMVSNTLLSARAPGTVMRTRGRILIEANTAGEDPVVELGIGVIDDAAFVAGGAAVPAAGSLEDWLWFGVLSIASKQSVATAGPAIAVFDIDSKAMRKFDLSSVVVLVVNGSAHTANMYGYVDVLTKRAG